MCMYVCCACSMITISAAVSSLSVLPSWRGMRRRGSKGRILKGASGVVGVDMISMYMWGGGVKQNKTWVQWVQSNGGLEGCIWVEFQNSGGSHFGAKSLVKKTVYFFYFIGRSSQENTL